MFCSDGNLGSQHTIYYFQFVWGRDFIKMKKIFIGLVVFIFVFALLTGCQGNSANKRVESVESEDPGVEIVLDRGMGDERGMYKGEMKNELPHGQGKFTKTTENEREQSWWYEGEWEDGLPFGQGTVEYSGRRAAKYIGNFNNQLLISGEGKQYEGNYLIYEGEFEDNIYHGQGTLYNNSKEVFSGKWNSGKPNKKEFEKLCQRIRPDLLISNVDAYMGSPIVIKGDVFEVEENGNYIQYRVVINKHNTTLIGVTYIKSDDEKVKSYEDPIEIIGYIQGQTNRSFYDRGRANRIPHIQGYYITNN